MAEPATTSITEDSLKAALTERLGAVHVEVTDMSGASPSPSPFPFFPPHPHPPSPFFLPPPPLLYIPIPHNYVTNHPLPRRRLRPILHLPDHIPDLRRATEAPPPPRRQRRPARRDRRHPRLERAVSDARGVGGREGEGRRRWGCGKRPPAGWDEGGARGGG